MVKVFTIGLVLLLLGCEDVDGPCLECFERTTSNANDISITNHLEFEFVSNVSIGVKCSQERQRLTRKYSNPASPIIEIDPLTDVRTLVTVLCR